MKAILGPTFHDPVDMKWRDDIELLVIEKASNTFEYARIQLDYGYISMKDTYITPENDTVEFTRP